MLYEFSGGNLVDGLPPASHLGFDCDARKRVLGCLFCFLRKIRLDNGTFQGRNCLEISQKLRREGIRMPRKFVGAQLSDGKFFKRMRFFAFFVVLAQISAQVARHGWRLWPAWGFDLQESRLRRSRWPRDLTKTRFLADCGAGGKPSTRLPPENS